jgi:hypothetical protein
MRKKLNRYYKQAKGPGVIAGSKKGLSGPAQ